MVQNVPLVGGLCLTVDFDQMWSEHMPLVGGLCHTADFDQLCSNHMPLIGGLSHTVAFDQMWSKRVPFDGGLCCQTYGTTYGTKTKSLVSSVAQNRHGTNSHIRTRIMRIHTYEFTHTNSCNANSHIRVHTYEPVCNQSSVPETGT